MGDRVKYRGRPSDASSRPLIKRREIMSNIASDMAMVFDLEKRQEDHKSNRRSTRKMVRLGRQEDESNRRSTQEPEVIDVSGQPGEDSAKAALLDQNDQFSDATIMAVADARPSLVAANRVQENLSEIQLFEQVVIDVAGQPGEDSAKAAWLDRNDQFSDATIMVVAGTLPSLLIANRFLQENLFKVQLCGLLLSPLVPAIGLRCFKTHISNKKDLSRREQITLMSLTLLTGTAVMAVDAVFLGFINKSYLGLITILVFGFIFILVFFYHELEFKENQETLGDPDEREGMVNNSFKFANVATTVGVLVQLTEITAGYMKNPKFPKDRTLYSLTMAFINTIVGGYAMVITSCPLGFKSKSMHGFLKLFPSVMAISLEILVAILSAEFLDPYMVVFVVFIPPFVEYLVRQWQNNCNSRAILDTSASTESVEVDSLFVTIVKFVYTILPPIYSVAIGSGGPARYKYSVLLLHLAITTSLIRMRFPLRLASQNGKTKVIETAFYSIPGIYAALGVALVLIEIYSGPSKR